MNGLLLTCLWLVASLTGWFVIAIVPALLIGKGIRMADEREAGPQSNTEPERWAA